MPAISGSAGWGQVSWSPRSNFGGSKDTNKFLSFSENWKRWFLRSQRLSNAGRRRRVSYARAATFHGKSGDPSSRDRPAVTVGAVWPAYQSQGAGDQSQRTE